MEVEIIYLQSNIECEYYLTRNDLYNTRLDLAECKKELKISKKKYKNWKEKGKVFRKSVRGYLEIISQQTEELSHLGEMLKVGSVRKMPFPGRRELAEFFTLRHLMDPQSELILKWASFQKKK